MINSSVFNSDKGVKALETYGSWISGAKVTPPGVLTYTWDEVATVFGSGQVAMGMNYHDMKLDPKVKGGEAGYFVFPGVKDGDKLVRGPHFGSWGVGISKYSKNKEAAYQLAEVLTSPDSQKGYLKFNQHVTRVSAYDAAKAIPDALTKEYYNVLGESLKVGVGRPRITNYDQVSEAVQIAVSDFLSGKKDAKKALDDGAKQVEDLMKQAGY
jgi:multiple sugar transport system substrate-binding protein